MKLLDQVSQALRVKHYSLATERCYCQWIRRFIFFHGVKHPNTMGAEEVERFLTHLATTEKVAASTQNQALNALVFLYREVLHIDLGNVDAVRARRPLRVGSRQWAVGSRQWAVGSRQWAVGSRQWAVGSGQWAVGSVCTYQSKGAIACLVDSKICAFTN